MKGGDVVRAGIDIKDTLENNPETELDLRIAFSKGRLRHQHGYPKFGFEGNPYPAGWEMWKAWSRGWESVSDDELQRREGK